MLIRAVCLSLVAMVAACSPVQQAPQAFNSSRPNTGVAVIALTKSGFDPWQVSYLFEQIDGDYHGKLEIESDMDGRIHSDYPQLQGNLKMVELPAGDYRITGWELRRWMTVRRSNTPLDVRFRVYPDKYTYAGELNLDTGNVRILETGSAGVSVRVKAGAERDIQHIQRNHPDIDFRRFRIRQMEFRLPATAVQ